MPRAQRWHLQIVYIVVVDVTESDEEKCCSSFAKFNFTTQNCLQYNSL